MSEGIEQIKTTKKDIKRMLKDAGAKKKDDIEFTWNTGLSHVGTFVGLSSTAISIIEEDGKKKSWKIGDIIDIKLA